MTTPNDQIIDRSLAQLRANVASAIPHALDKAALVLREEISNELSRPGSGRFYPKRRAKGSTSAKAAKARKSFNRRLSGVARALNAGAPLASVKKSFIKSLHRASAPGESPAPDTNELKRSVAIQVDGDVRNVGAFIKYAAPLHFGTRWIKPRPFMTKALVAAQARLQAAFGVVMSEVKP